MNNPNRFIDPDGMITDNIDVNGVSTDVYYGEDAVNFLSGLQQQQPPQFHAFVITGTMTLEEMLAAAGVKGATGGSGGFLSYLEAGPKSIATVFASILLLKGDNITWEDRERFASNAITNALNKGDVAAAEAQVKAWNADKRNANDRIVFRYMSIGEFNGIRKGSGGNFLDPLGPDGLFSEKHITPDFYTSSKIAQERLSLPNSPQMAVWTFESSILQTKNPPGPGVYEPVGKKYGQDGGGNQATISQPMPIIGGFTLHP